MTTPPPSSTLTPSRNPAVRLTTLTAVAAVLAALGLTVGESAFGFADAEAAIRAANEMPCANDARH